MDRLVLVAPITGNIGVDLVEGNALSGLVHAV